MERKFIWYNCLAGIINLNTIKNNLPLILLLLFSLGFRHNIIAQNNEVSVNVQVLPPYSNNIYDYIGSNEKITRSFQEQILVTLRNNNPNRSYEVKLIASVLGNNGVEAIMNQNFQPFQRIILPAGEMKIISGRDLAEINRNLTESDLLTTGIDANQIRRTGTLPEGSYRICFQAFDYRTGESLSSTEPFGCSAPVSISFPDPPVIAYPFNESVILATTPQSFNISWAPVQNASPRIRYRVKIVELTDINANPYDLMEQSNVAYYQEENLMMNNIFYDQTKPQLKIGNTYAIRVQAYDPLGQINIKNNGLSEINLFRYDDSYDDGSGLADIEYINLVPGYVKLTNLEDLEYSKTAGIERFNGYAKLAFTNPLTETEELINVQVNNLALNANDRQNPTFLSGSVMGALSRLPELMQNLEGLVTPSDINWDYQEGLTLEGELALADGTQVPVSGTLQISPGGAFGQLRSGGQQTPIYEINTEMVRLKITEIIASFPENTVKGDGFLEFLDHQQDSLSNGPCMIEDIDLLQDQVAINVNCLYNESFALVENSEKVMLRFEGVNGTVLANWQAGSLDYDLQLLGILDLKTNEGAYNCGINVSLNLDLGADPQFNVLGNNCALNDRSIFLGLVQVNLRNIELNEISYLEGIWDFELAMDGDFLIPMFDNWTSPEVQGILINKEGIKISAQEWSLDELQDLQVVGWDSLISLSPQNIKLDALVYPWYDQNEGLGPWNMSALGTASIQNLPIVPCLNDYDYDFRLYYNSEDGIYGELSGEGEGCSWDFARESSLAITKLKGELFAEIESDRTIRSASLELTGNLNNQFLFQCDKDISFDNVFLKLDKDFIKGRVEQFSPECPIQIGPFGAEITSSVLVFDIRDEDQEVLLDAKANLLLPDSSKVEGTFLYDMVAGEFLELEFELADPFTWNIPEDDPVLSFYIEEAIINLQGFLIDGRNTLKLPGGKDINATFDNLALDINTMDIKEGRVIFDESFAFEAGIDTSDYSLNYKAVEQGQTLTLNPALYFSLGANVSLDSAGLKTGGDASAKLLLGDQNFVEGMSVDFSEDFTIGLYPFIVSVGRADLLIEEKLIAYINDQGLNIDPLDFVLDALPDKLPLPANDIAYLQIRDLNGDLLIKAEKLPNGNIKIETLPGNNLQFYLPAVNPGNPPVLGNVELDGVQLNADISNPSIDEGTIIITVPENSPQLNNLDLPVKIKQIAYGTNLFNSTNEGLYLSGDLKLFDTELPEAGNVYIWVDQNGYAQATFNMSNQELDIPLVPNSEIVMYQLQSLSGNFAAYLNDISAQSFALDLSGKFTVQDQQVPVASADLSLHLEPGSFQVTNFESRLDNNPIDLDFGSFGLKIKEITSLPIFNYTDANGFDFAAQLNLDLYMDLANGERFQLPLEGLEIRKTGLHIPTQNISPSSIPGLAIPAINIGGFELELMALRTSQPSVFNWYNLSEWNFNPSIDLAVRMPELAARGLNIPDGLSFYNASFENGLLSGAMAPFEPPAGIDIKLGSFPEAPNLNITKIFGELLPDSINGGQDFNFDLEGKLADLPGFNIGESQPCVNPVFSLSIIEGRAFEGTVNNFTPCGNLELGPFILTPQSSELKFAYENAVQEVSLDGLVRLDLLADPSPNGLADGNLKLNLLNGSLMDGYIAINQSFPFDYPLTNPLLSFTLNQARLDTTGFTMQGTGNLNLASTTNNVSFNNLKLSLQDLTIKSGNANLGSNLNLDFMLSPLGLSLSEINSTRSFKDHLRMSFDADVLLTKDGISYSGTSTSAIRFAGEDYPELRAEFLNNFALNVNNLSVSNGRAEIYYDENGQQAEEPLAILDVNGFSMGGGVVALLPDTLSFPTKEVAYIILKDAQGNSLINATQNESNGWDLSTKPNQPLTLVVPALANGQSPPQTEVTFSLSTDSNYNPNGGSISLSTGVNLEPNFGLPIELTTLSLIAGNSTEVSVDIKVNLPESISSEDITSAFRVNNNGFTQGTLEWGTYTQSYDAAISPAFSQSIQGTLPGDNQEANLAIQLYGLKAELGANMSLKLAGALESDLLAEENQAPDPLFFYADYSNQSWTGGVDASHLIEGVKVGQLRVQPNPQQPFELLISQQEFLISVDGIIDFEEMVGEPLQVSIKDLQIGVDYTQASPQPIFGMGGGSVTMADQNIDLFGGEVILALDGPKLQITGREIAISSDGTIDVFGENIDFTELSISSNSGFSLGNVALSTRYAIIPGYAEITSIALAQQQQKLSFSAEIDVTLPAPVGSTATATVSISRESNNQVSVEVEGPEFNLNEKYAVGQIAEFQLDKVVIDIEPSNMDQFGIYAAGKVLIDGQPRVYFGDAASIRTNPGIAYANNMLRYNATGNASFDLDEGFFNIQITANMAVSNATQFEVELGGSAGVNINGVGGTLDYEGFTIGPDGVTDRGNLAGSGSLTLMDFASLTIGQFQYEVPKNGEQTVTVNLPATNSDPSSFESKSNPDVQMVPTEVKRFVRFGGGTGPALELTLGGSNPDEEGSGGFGGGVDEVVFYELPNGDKYLKIDNANMSIGRTMSCSAFLEYKEENGGFILRATAVAELGIGTTTAKAALAGYFANANDELKFGLFVGVEVGTGIPLFPGVIDLKGGGAGFFYKPTQTDLDLVTSPQNGALKAFGHTLVQNELSNPVSTPAISDYDFAVMLFAKVGIGGSAGNYALTGSTFIQITNRGVYLDAYGTVLGLDGGGATALKLKGGAYVEASFDHFFIDGVGYIDMEMPVVLDGRMDLIFFFAENPSSVGDETAVVWAIDGELDVTVYSILDMTGTIIACPSGLYMDAGVGVKFGKYGFSVDADFMGSVWYVNEGSFRYPFGAYLRAGVELCFLKVCAHPTAKAAFATLNGGGFELVVGAEACVDIPVWGEECAHAMATIKSGNGFSVDVGTGKMKSSLFDEAEGMKARFEQIITDLKQEINDTKDAIENFESETPALEIPDNVLMSAGHNFHTNPFGRFLANMMIVGNINEVANPLPPDMQWVKDNILVGGSNSQFPMERITKYGDEYDQVKAYKQKMKDAMDTSTLFLEEALIRMAKINGVAYDFKEQAENTFEEMLVALETSPVMNTNLTIQKGADGEILSSPSFTVDEEKAAQQNEKSAEAEGFNDKMKIEFESAILATERNLQALDSMLSKKLERNTSQNTTGSGNQNSGINYQSNDYNNYAITSVIHQSNNIAVNVAAQYYHNNLLNTYFPSVGDVTANLRDAVEAIERYYAFEGSFRARQYNWMNHAHQQLGLRQNSIISSLGNIYDANQNKSDSFLEENMKDRINLIYTLSDASQDEKDDMLNSTSLSEESFTRSLNNVWYDMHALGLDQAKYNIAFNVIKNIREERGEALSIINNPYNTLSEEIDNAYVLKSEILTLLHGLYQQYDKLIKVSDSTDADSDVNTLQQEISTRISNIENALMPPSINNIIVFSRRSHFRNRADITWTASSTPAETSFHIQRMGDNTVATGFGSGSYKSLGNKNKLYLHSFKDAFPRGSNPDEIAMYETKQFSVGFRLRSKGGITSIRRANFNVAVGNNSSVPNVQWTNINETDNTPPTISYMTFLPYNNEAYANPSNPSEENYYTSDQQSQYFQVGARDDQSDIVKFEYAVGSTKGGTDIQDWSLLTGERIRNIQNGYGYTGPDRYLLTELIGRVNSLTLENNKRYYFSAKVTNGEGLTTTRSMSIPLAYDGTPPSKPARQYTLMGFTSFYFGSSTVYPTRVKPMATSTPVYRPLINDITQIYDRLENNPNMPEIDFNWAPASDDESGIFEYQYYASKDSVFDEDQFTHSRATKNTQVSIRAYRNGSIPPLQENKPFIARYAGSSIKDFGPHYFYIRAKNNANLYGETRRLGPFRASDPTAPDLPDMQVTEKPNSLRIHIIENSFDPESGLKGYQYALGTSANTIDLEGFPNGSQVNWEFDNYDALLKGVSFNFSLSGGNSGPEQPIFDIDKSDLPHGEPIYVFFRAVNQQGMKSGMVACGPIILDDTPPLVPNITLSTISDKKVKINLNDVHDPESGITKVVYRVSWKDNGITKKTSRITGFQVSNPTLGSRNLNFTRHIGNYDAGSIRVNVWVYNGRGENTFTSKTLPLQYIRYSGQSNFQFISSW